MKYLLHLFLLLNLFSSSIAQTTISYGPDSLQTLDYYPASNSNSPILIIVHGGGWYTGDKSGAAYQNAAQLFQSKGYAVININYRLTPDVTYPSHIEDLACALAWTKNNVSLFNGDSSRVAIYGHSAGGQIAAYLGVRPMNSMLSGCSNTEGLNIDGVVLTSATVDFDLTNSTNWQRIVDMLGDSALYWNVAQPTNHCANNFETIFLILCGENDNLGIEQDSVFHDSLQFYNHCSQLKMFLGNDHNSLLDNLSATDSVFNTMISFLDSLWQETLCLTTGVKTTQLSDNFLKIYQNPFTIHATIQSGIPFQNTTLIVYNCLGEKVKQVNNLTGHTITLYRDNLLTGFFVFQIWQNDQIIWKGKLAIQ